MFVLWNERISRPILHGLLTSKSENKYNIWSWEKPAQPFYRKKQTQFNNDYCGPNLLNELAHDNFRKLDALPLFHKKIKEFILMFHNAE